MGRNGSDAGGEVVAANWWLRLVAEWRRRWLELPASVREQVSRPTLYLAPPVQASLYRRHDPRTSIELYAMWIRRADDQPDGVVQTSSGASIDEPEAVASQLDWRWEQMLDNWFPGRPQQPAPTFRDLSIWGLDGPSRGQVWLAPGDLTAANPSEWVADALRNFQSPPAPPPSAPPPSRVAHLHGLGENSERTAMERLLSIAGDELMAALGICGPWWCALNVDRRDLFEDGHDGDIDLIAGALELDLGDAEWKSYVQAAASGMALTANSDRVIASALARACEDRAFVWPPRVDNIAACEAKGSWFDVQMNKWKRTHSGELPKIGGQLDYMLERGIDRVALLHISSTKPEKHVGGNPWEQAANDEYVPPELAGIDKPLLAIVDVHPDLGPGITIGAQGQSGAFDALAESAELLKGLRQLDRSKPNILVIDATRDFIHDPFVSTAANRHTGAFSRHPELNAIILSRIGVYWTIDDYRYVEDVVVVPNPSSQFTLPDEMMAALKQGPEDVELS